MLLRSLLGLVLLATFGCSGDGSDKVGDDDDVTGDDDDDTTGDDDDGTGDDDDDTTGDDDDDLGTWDPVGDWTITSIRLREGTTSTTTGGGTTYVPTGYYTDMTASSDLNIVIASDGNWGFRQSYTTTTSSDYYTPGVGGRTWSVDAAGVLTLLLEDDQAYWECERDGGDDAASCGIYSEYPGYTGYKFVDFDMVRP